MMEWLRAHPPVVDLITPWVITTGVAFVAGVLTRFTYTLLVAGVILWAYVAMSIQSTHPHSTLVLTLAALIPARWGDAFSVDAWWRRHRGGERSGVEATKQYGYTVWVPVLTFGVCFAAAAWAKLTVPAGWTTWILNGTIKYHIVSDSPSAPVAWGLQLAHHPFLAVLASFGTIAIEAVIVTAAFVRSERYRLVIGAAAGVLFCGIGLFMGIVWPGWWIPLLAFLPWQHWSRCLPAVHERAAATSSRRMTWNALTSAQLIVVACVIAQQVAVSALKLERAPMFSWYRHVRASLCQSCRLQQVDTAFVSCRRCDRSRRGAVSVQPARGIREGLSSRGRGRIGASRTCDARYPCVRRRSFQRALRDPRRDRANLRLGSSAVHRHIPAQVWPPAGRPLARDRSVHGTGNRTG